VDREEKTFHLIGLGVSVINHAMSSNEKKKKESAGRKERGKKKKNSHVATPGGVPGCP